MNTIIEAIQEYIKGCPLLDEYARAVGVDYLGKNPTCYSIETTPCDPIIKRYVNGDSVRQYQFMFVSRDAYGQQTRQNLDNLGFYERFSDWMESQSKARVFPCLPAGMTPRKIEALTVGYPMETDPDSAKYMIQCKLTYYRKG